LRGHKDLLLMSIPAAFSWQELNLIKLAYNQRLLLKPTSSVFQQSW